MFDVRNGEIRRQFRTKIAERAVRESERQREFTVSVRSCSTSILELRSKRERRCKFLRCFRWTEAKRKRRNEKEKKKKEKRTSLIFSMVNFRNQSLCRRAVRIGSHSFCGYPSNSRNVNSRDSRWAKTVSTIWKISFEGRKTPSRRRLTCGIDRWKGIW